MMAIIKCKMCGGDLEITEGVTVAKCEYCDTKQTIPSADNEKKLTLFSRANRLRLACEFDTAASVYESIVADFPTEAEAYWGLVLCRYGIEYVDDPATGKKIPTCHRLSFDSILEDGDFAQACENTDAIARRVYRDEAKVIENIRKGILEVSGKEEPYDIFICYKETDESGERTVDSVLAQDVYDALARKGYRVFFSRITLEDKLGTAYEPYIFAALNSAKVMLAFGTDYEYFSAVWVKNEWSRFLKLMTQDKGKHLIPCYKGIDAYDMPKEFAKLQAQDMGKVGASQDLLRGIDKLLGRQEEVVKETVVIQQGTGPNVDSLLKRGYFALEDGHWAEAKDFFGQALNIHAECGSAYFGLELARKEVNTPEKLAEWYSDKDEARGKDLERAKRYADADTAEKLAAFQASLIMLQKQQEEEKKLREQEKLEKKELAEREIIPRLAKKREELAQAAGVICVTQFHTIGLCADGTVVAAGGNTWGQCNVSDWQDIVAVSANWNRTVGLRVDGTVVAVGDNKYGQCNVADWRDIVAISAEGLYTAGLHADGTVVNAGDSNSKFARWEVSDWRDIVSISTGFLNLLGLRLDGTVAIPTYIYNDENEDEDEDDNYYYYDGNVSDWQDIVAIRDAGGYTVGLHVDGTVVAVGLNDNGQCNVSDWEDIVDIDANHNRTVGLCADGTVVAVGLNDNGQCNVSDWEGIVDIDANHGCTVGLRADGTVVAVGDNKDGQCNVSGWKLFDSLDSLVQEREAARARRETLRQECEAACTRRRTALETERTSLGAELSNLKGLFSFMTRKSIEARLAEIEAELKKL